MRERGQTVRRVVLVLTATLLASCAGFFPVVDKVEAGNFSQRTLASSTSVAGATNVSYTLSFSGQSSGVVGSIRLQLCTNDPFPGNVCTAPDGLDMSHATLSSQNTMTGFTVSGHTSSNQLVLTRSPASSTSGLATYALQNITNPTATGVIYGRLETFASTDATGAHLDAGGLAISISPNAMKIQTYVPPFLTFCIGNTIQGHDCSTALGNYVDFGVLSPSQTASSHTMMVIATNAEFGYSIRCEGTTLTSGINTIPALSVPDVSKKGVSQFGLNLRTNTTPSFGSDPSGAGVGQPTATYDVPNYYKFVSGDTLVSYSHPDDFRTFSVNYIVNVAKDQPAGVYVTTMTYIAMATF